MTRKVIAFDIDGVLTDFEKYVFDEGSKYVESRIKNVVGDDISQVYKVSMELECAIWKNLIEDYAKNYPSRKYTSEVISKLKEKHDVIIITNRSSDVSYCDMSKEEMEDAVVKWLEKEGILYDKIFFNKGSKLKCCQENNVDIMIEDMPENIIDLSEKGIKVICFDAYYNRDIKSDKIQRCYSMYDLYKICNEVL